MLSLLLAPLRLVLLVVGMLACLVVVPVVETLRGIGEEWVLAFWQARRFLRSAAA